MQVFDMGSGNPEAFTGENRGNGDVITSYSIHYTKLYDNAIARFDLLEILGKMIQEPFKLFLIGGLGLLKLAEEVGELHGALVERGLGDDGLADQVQEIVDSTGIHAQHGA